MMSGEPIATYIRFTQTNTPTMQDARRKKHIGAHKGDQNEMRIAHALPIDIQFGCCSVSKGHFQIEPNHFTC